MTLSTAPGVPGRPGVYLAPARAPDQLRLERLDIAGFVGVALRGPTDRPVRITRWSDYVRTFGGFDPVSTDDRRLLPYAVSAFFRQGGQVAYVLRLAPHDASADAVECATARFRIAFPSGDQLDVRAANEGTWGTGLKISLRFAASQRVRVEFIDATTLRLPPGALVPVGTLLRLSSPRTETSSTPLLRWVTGSDARLARTDALRITVDGTLPFAPSDVIDAEVVTATLDVEDRSGPGLAHRLTGLGLRPEHPRWIAGSIVEAAELIVPAGDWTQLDLTPTVALSPLEALNVFKGADRSPRIDDAAFFDENPSAARALEEDAGPDAPDPHVGVDRMAGVEAIGLLCVPDLSWNLALASADGLARLVARQERLVQTAEAHRRFVALIDVPRGLSADRISGWRARFDSSFAAAYHPWLAVADGTTGGAVSVPPSAFAAGIIAARELRLGLPWGPANELAKDAVRAESVVTDALHGRLHGLGINVFRAERDGFRLTAARTLSSDPEYRQLSVRRLMTMLTLSLEQQTQALAFEPNTAELRDRMAWLLTGFLRNLARRGAFAGAGEADSFFVDCGDGVNPPASLALGRVVAEIGVAPSAPLEYIMVRIARDPDGNLAVVGDD